MNQEAAALDVLVEVLELDVSDEDELVLVVVSVFFSVEPVDGFSALSVDVDGAADFLASEPRLSLR
jgi:hypothetical protein